MVAFPALAAIVVDGPASLAAGAAATYTLSGYDQYGDPFPLAQSTLAYTAPTTAGPAIVSYTERNVTGTKTVSVVAGALHAIVVTGPDLVRPGSTTPFALAGFDAYGNPAPLAQSSLSFTAPLVAGPAVVSYTEQGIVGAKLVTVVADALSSIAVTGPDAVLPGSVTTFALAGFDAYGNPAPLAQPSLSFTAPLVAGPAVVSYTEQGVTGTKNVTVTPGPLDRIEVTPGTLTLAAGAAHTFIAATLDAYANPVAANLTWTATCGAIDAAGHYTAPASAGTCIVTAADGSRAGNATVNVVGLPPPPVSPDYTPPSLPNPLASILVTGPDTLAAGTTATYDLAGRDASGNPVSLYRPTLTYTAPTTAGPATVSYTERGVTGTKPIQVTPGPVVSVSLQGPDTVPAGSVATFRVVGYDQYGNPIDLGFLEYAAPTDPGAGAPCYSGPVSACKAITVTAGPLSAIAVTGPDAIVAGETAAFALAGADAYGNPVPLLKERLLVRETKAGATDVTYSEAGVTGSKRVRVDPGPLSTLRIDGPTRMVAGTTATFTLSGFDAYGNPVPIADDRFEYTAPATPGPAQVCRARGAASGCLAIEVVPASPLEETTQPPGTSTGATVSPGDGGSGLGAIGVVLTVVVAGIAAGGGFLLLRAMRKP
jgi:hypothetical protein